MGLWKERQTVRLQLFTAYRDKEDPAFVFFKALLRARAGAGAAPRVYRAVVHVTLRLGWLGRLLFMVPFLPPVPTFCCLMHRRVSSLLCISGSGSFAEERRSCGGVSLPLSHSHPANILTSVHQHYDVVVVVSGKSWNCKSVNAFKSGEYRLLLSWCFLV